MELHRRAQRAPSHGVPGNGAQFDDDGPGYESKGKPRRLGQPDGSRWEWLRSSLILGLAIVACYAFITWHFWWTPNPEVPSFDNRTGMARFSENIARGHIKYLSETIGFRQVGCQAHADAMEMVKTELERILDDAKTIAAARGFAPLDMEIEVLRSTGSHRFDIAGKVVHKIYQNIPSVVARISCGERCDGADYSERWSRPAVLLNSHVDTNYGSRGAADAASGIAVMLETARVLLHSPLREKMKNPVVLLFNGAEETLQDASHAFLFSSPHNKSARALINMEACGQGGREALFQVNAYGMAEAYKKGGKWYHGSSLANDVFGTGLVLSDTDFRQFVAYSSDVVGVDLAYYTNSYVYHTTRDVESTIGKGSIRHMGDNVVGMAIFLATETNLLDEKFERGMDFLHYDFLGYFMLYRWTVALPLHLVLIGAGFTLYVAWLRRELASSVRTSTTRRDVYLAHFFAFISVLASLAFAAAGVALVNVAYRAFGVRPMVWFSRAWYPVLLFGPAVALGFSCGQWLVRLLVARISEPLSRSSAIEARTLAALLLWFMILLLAATIARIGSSFLVMFQAGGLLVASAVAFFATRPKAQRGGFLGAAPPAIVPERVPISAYISMLLVSGPITMGYAISMSELFVPLLGRIGHTAPVDAIAGGLAVVCFFMALIFYLPFLHRFGARHLRNSVVFLVIIATISAVVFSQTFPFDRWAPKRLYVQHRHNVTSGQSFVDMAHADGEWVALNEAVATVERDALGIVNSETAIKRIESQLRERGFAKYLEWESLYPFK